MHFSTHSLLIFLLVLLSSCRVGPTYYPPETDSPPEWKHAYEDFPLPYQDYWWEVFDDSTLNSLELLAVENNKDLDVALDRVRQARAQVGIVSADLYPQLTLNPLYNNQDSLIKLFGPGGSNSITSPFLRAHELTYSLPLNLSYEIDLWGQLRDRSDSAFYNLQAQENAYNGALLILTADVASSYYQIRALDSLIELFTQTIQTRKKAFEINKDRYRFKVNDYQPVALAGLDLSNVESQYYAAIRQRELEINALALLLGLSPAEFTIESNPLKELPPTIPAGIPSTALLRRPDIAEAERVMASQHALINASYASLFPSLTLTGALGFLSPDYKHFLQWISRLWQYGANSNQMVFDGGRIYSEIELSWANFEEASDAYKQTVLTAFREVEDALASIEWIAKEEESVQQSVDYAQTAYKISKDRFLRGVDFYLAVADNERQLLDNQRALVTLLEARYIATIQLIKALGGSFGGNCDCGDFAP